MKDWLLWHSAYEDPDSSLSSRLRMVRSHLARAITGAPAGPIRVLSLCAGQGHDVIGVLPDHPRRDDVSAVLVEADPRNVTLARLAAAGAGLSRVEVREADAGLVPNYADALPADVLLLCGIFGNISDDDINRIASAAPAMCRGEGATVIWTRHRRPPDLTPRVREWFAASGFGEVAFDGLGADGLTGIGAGQLARPAPGASLPDGRLFTFRGA